MRWCDLCHRILDHLKPTGACQYGWAWAIADASKRSGCASRTRAADTGVSLLGSLHSGRRRDAHTVESSVLTQARWTRLPCPAGRIAASTIPSSGAASAWPGGCRDAPPSATARCLCRDVRRSPTPCGQLGADVCAQVPGFYVAERDGRRWWSLAGAAGLLIPVRNLDGHIVALKVRADDPGDGPKYTTISSAKHGGPSPGAQVHVPLHGRRSVVIPSG